MAARLARDLERIEALFEQLDVTMATYGLRRSEVCGLRWSDIDLTRETLNVEQGHVEVEGKEHAHMCSSFDGRPVLPRTFTGWFHRIRIAAELPRITLRDLRHTSVSVMLHANVPASTVAAWHGHDVRMTTAVYNRVYDEGLTTAAAAMFGDIAAAV